MSQTLEIPIKPTNIFATLQADILRLQGFKAAKNRVNDAGIGPFMQAFPNSTFPTNAVHEFVSNQAEDAAATASFLSCLMSLSGMMQSGTALWISANRKIFPPALSSFGLVPDRFLFLHVPKERDMLWAMEEALKCSGLTSVIGEIRFLSFTASRRLQLAVEQSNVTGFILREGINQLNTTACVSRWRITSHPSQSMDDMPGIGFPAWRVELMKVRNGKPGVWGMKWVNKRFEPVYKFSSVSLEHYQKTG